jgi:hypothetical protein
VTGLGGPGQGPWSVRAARTDVLAASEVCSTPARLEVADIIVCRDRLRGRSPRTMLAQYPGCLAAVTGVGGGACLLAVRHASLMRITAGPGQAAPGDCALLSGLFACGWLAVGGPLPLLDQARLRLAGPLPGGWAERVYEAGVSVSLAVSGGGAGARPRAEWCCRTSSASGAPVSV